MTQLKTIFPLHAPILVPIRGTEDKYPVSRIFCVGRNYEAHANEMGVAVDREAPFYFTKSADTYVSSGATVQYPPGTSDYHYEMELVLAIGREAFQVKEAQALEYVYGYACGLDMTRRDLQLAAREQRRPWDLGKDFEQSAVMSEVVPASQCGHLSSGSIELRVNGQTKQSSDLSLLIHHVPALIAHLSTYYHLKAGDLIYTGTPEGVGPVVSGDHIQGSIAGLGDIELWIS